MVNKLTFTDNALVVIKQKIVKYQHYNFNITYRHLRSRLSLETPGDPSCRWCSGILVHTETLAGASVVVTEGPLTTRTGVTRGCAL